MNSLVLAVAVSATLSTHALGASLRQEVNNALSEVGALNVAALLNGYDILSFSTLKPTEALRSQVWAADYSDNEMTSDQKWKVPNGLSMSGILSCAVSATSETITGETSYMTSQTSQVDVSAGGGVGPASGSMQNSNTAKSTSEQTNGNQNTLTRTSMTCGIWKLAVEQATKPLFDKNFLKSVVSLKKSSDPKAFTALLDQFGTHTIMGANVGSMYVTEFTSNAEQSRALQSQGSSSTTGASAAAFGMSTGLSVSSSSDSSQAMAFTSESTVSNTYTIGTAPPQGASEQEILSNWIQMTNESPSLGPVSNIQFQSLNLLFAPSELGNINKNLKANGDELKLGTSISASDLANLEKRIKEAIVNYCASKPSNNCLSPKPDVPVPPPYTVTLNQSPGAAVPLNDSHGSSSSITPASEQSKLTTWYGYSGLSYMVMPRSVITYWGDCGSAHGGCTQKTLAGIQIEFTDATGKLGYSSVLGKNIGARCKIDIPPGVRVGAVGVGWGLMVDIIALYPVNANQKIPSNACSGGSMISNNEIQATSYTSPLRSMFQQGTVQSDLAYLMGFTGRAGDMVDQIIPIFGKAA